MIAQFPEFTPLSAVSRDEFSQHTNAFDPYSDYGFTSLYVWGRDGEQHVSLHNGNLVLSMQDYMSERKVLSFIGTNNVTDTAIALLDFAEGSDNYCKALSLVPAVTASKLDTTVLAVEADRDNHDYILDTRRFHDLDGPKFSHTRRKISQFKRHVEDGGIDVAFRADSLEDAQVRDAITDLAYRWAFMGTQGSITAHEEIAAIKRLLTDLDVVNGAKNIHCLSMYIDGSLSGFCVFEVQNSYATVHFIKADLEVPGSSDMVMTETMRHIHAVHGIELVNHEQDLGIEGLRAAKERYCPVSFLEKYTVSRPS